MTNTQIKSFIIILAIYYAQTYNEFAGPISESLRLLQRWWAVGSTVSDFTGIRFEPQTPRPTDKSVSSRLTGRYKLMIDIKLMMAGI